MPKCDQPTAPAAATIEVGNPAARRAAQRGLEYLADAAVQWQNQHKCYGCHVQAVTLEALSVGIHHQYDIGKPQVRAVLGGMLDLKGGARHETGLGYTHGGSIYDAGKLFGTAAFARFDQWVGRDVEDELLTNARMLLERQESTGAVSMSYTNRPVAIGTLQGTSQAVVAWKQAYERSADYQWLIAVSKAEDYLRGMAANWLKQPPSSIQELNYTIIGLLAAGASIDEDTVASLAKVVLSRQNSDGGWARQQNGGSEPYATGQSLYTLRLLGLTDQDKAIARGISWLVERQQDFGAWSRAGFGKAEAMWGVLGLVSMDVVTIAVDGLGDGQHVSGTRSIKVEARDNGGAGVQRVEIHVDDIPVHGSCGSQTTFAWNTKGLSTGAHIVDVVAINSAGKKSRRRLEVYAGDYYMTQVGSRFSDGGTQISLRNIAEASEKSQIAVEIFATEDKDGVVQPTTKLATMKQDGAQGAMQFFWNGKSEQGKEQSKGKYIARLSYRDASGREVQTHDLEFVHDTLKAQRANWGQVQGQLALPSADAAANVDVELVDDRGVVVSRTKSTGAGSYRFRNVKAGKKYKVRVRKKGFSAEADVAPARAGEDAKADMDLAAD